MRTRFLQLAALTLAGLALTAFAFGGWAVITVDELPAGLVVGQPVKIGFTVRQHGMKLLDQLAPTLVAVDEEGGAPQVRSSAPASGSPGHYRATLTVPRAGDWTITIASGFLGSHVTLYPIAAVAAGTRPRTPEAPAQVGRRLFVAKGCVTCHVHDGVSGNMSVRVGPDLTPRRYQADYLARLLADPSIARKPGQQFTMPALGLQRSEIDALIAFINAEGR